MFNYENVYINDFYGILGPLYNKTSLKKYNNKIDDYYYGTKTPLQAEIKLNEQVINKCLKHCDLIVGSNLINQLSSTCVALKNKEMPFLGSYSACSSFCQNIIILSCLVNSKFIKCGGSIISSHNLTAEKQFRYPNEYGAPKPLISTITATGAIGFTISSKPSKYRIVNATLGSIKDSYLCDANNMGGVMAISAYEVIKKHFNCTKTSFNDYDVIITGDLGKVGRRILLDMYKKDGIEVNNIIDAGENFYINNKYSGASGPAVLPLYFFFNTLHKKYKKILLVATGSLHNPEIVNQKLTIPSISHAVTIEVK